eukprot:4720873-Amphidinium_carterae.1
MLALSKGLQAEDTSKTLSKMPPQRSVSTKNMRTSRLGKKRKRPQAQKTPHGQKSEATALTEVMYLDLLLKLDLQLSAKESLW